MSKFDWVPAATTFLLDGGTGIYVRYGRFPNRVVVKERGHNYTWVQCPDREFILTANQNKLHSFRPMAGNYDEYVSLSVFDDALAKDHDFGMLMVNYTNDMDKPERGHATRRNIGDAVPNTTLLADSGGFQLFQQRYEFLDPVKIVQWYNENTDIGLILDIPVPVYDMKLFKKLAKIQKHNTELMMQHKAPHLELMNIIHGNDRESIDLFRKHVERPDITRLALAGAYRGTIMSGLNNMYDAMHTGQKYEQYHVLGVSTPMQTVLLMRMAALGFAPHITCDSSTALQKGVAREYHCHPIVQDRARFLVSGFSGGYKPSPYNELPCSCPVCATVKYSDVLFCIMGNPVTRLFCMHNLFSLKRYFNSMFSLCQTLETPELKELLRTQLYSSRSGYDEAIHGLDFLDAIKSDGIESARQQFRIYLNTMTDYSPSRSTGIIVDDKGAIGTVRKGVTAEELERNTTVNSVEYNLAKGIVDTYSKYVKGVEITTHGKAIKDTRTDKRDRLGSNSATGIQKKVKPLKRREKSNADITTDSESLPTTG